MGEIPTRDLLHGAALLQLISINRPLTVEITDGGYVLNDGKMSVYLKITTKQGKAQFTFSPSNLQEMMAVQRQSDVFYLGLVSHADGICALTWDEFASLIAIDAKTTKTLSLRKGHRSRFRVSGSDSEAELTIPANRWTPDLIPL